jgi:hypothetical protein
MAVGATAAATHLSAAHAARLRRGFEQARGATRAWAAPRVNINLGPRGLHGFGSMARQAMSSCQQRVRFMAGRGDSGARPRPSALEAPAGGGGATRYGRWRAVLLCRHAKWTHGEGAGA